MKNAIKSLLLLLIFSSFSQILHSQPNPDTDKLDHYFTTLLENNRFMGSVFIMQNDEILFSNAYGLLSADGTQASPESIYRIGSITKSYTAAMILLLAEKEKLTLDTTLEHYFPAMPNAGSITIEHLLRHKSGLVNFTNLEGYLEYHLEYRSRNDHLAHFEQIGSSFEPGESTEYSNTAYVLLGFIIEELTGLRYAEALLEMISEPLDFKATYFGDGIHPSLDEAESFTYRDGNWSVATKTDMSVPHAAGAIVSTAEETATFYSSLFGGRLLNESSLKLMTSFEGPFGLGLIRIPFHEKFLFGHNGGIDGYQTNSAHDPENNLTFAVLGNGVNYNFNDILIGMLSITYGMDFEIPEFEERHPITLTDEQLAAYKGTYASQNFPLKISLFIEQGNLMAQATGQGAFPLTIYDEQTMAFEQAGIELVFEETINDRFNEFIFTQAGSTFRFTREEE